MNALKIEGKCGKIKDVYIEKLLFLGLQCSKRAENGVQIIAEIIAFGMKSD